MMKRTRELKTREITRGLVLACLAFLSLGGGIAAQRGSAAGRDSVVTAGSQGSMQFPPNFIALDILASNDGFGLGTFYRREINPDLFWSISFSISESKDGREVERVDPYTGATYTPGKLNRFMVLPLFGGLQRRMFREDITDTFRPFLNAGVGPVMIYEMPYSKVVPLEGGQFNVEQVDFFAALSQGTAHFTFGGFIGFGANFGTDQSTVFGINFRYYFIPLAGEGLPSLFNPYTGEISSSKSDFGGFFITMHIGTGY
jgi:hypothetical protein